MISLIVKHLEVLEFRVEFTIEFMAILMDDSHELLSTIIALFGVVPLLVAEEDEAQLLVFTMMFDEFTAASG